MHTSLTLTLILSLLFGIGQVVVGGWLLLSGRRRWRNARVFLLLLAGAWFVSSGVIELFVSGMELFQRLSGTPDNATFALWRGRADSVLAIVTVAILLTGIAGALSGKLVWRRRSPVTPVMPDSHEA